MLEKGQSDLRPIFPFPRERIDQLNCVGTDIRVVSRIIRQCVFKETKYHVKKAGTYYIATQNMTDAQYKLYVSAFDNIANALEKSRSEAVEKGLNCWADKIELVNIKDYCERHGVV